MSLAETQAPTQECFHPLPHILSARAGDTTVLMNRQRGTYHTLNGVSGRIWELLGPGATTSAIITRLLEEYEVPRKQLESDVAATVLRLQQDRLIDSGSPAVKDPNLNRRDRTASQAVEGSRKWQMPSVLQCGVLLLILKLALKVYGYSRTLDWISLKVDRVRVRNDVDIATVRAAEYRVALAAALYPGRARCLEQSLTLYYLLRRQGIPVNYQQGVQPYPFQAHAWIEYRDEVINDVPEHAGFFARFPEQLP